MGIIKDRHIAYRDANLAAMQKRHKGSRFYGTSSKDKHTFLPNKLTGCALWLDASKAATVIASDDFNRANGSLGTPVLGSAWINARGAISIVTNQASTTENSNVSSAVIETGQSDVDITVTLVALGPEAGTVTRNTNATDGVRFGPSAVTAFGGPTFSPSTYSSAFVGGDVMRVKAVGPNYTVYKNGTQVLAFTSTYNQSATRHGLAFGSGGTNTWDNLSITTYGAATDGKAVFALPDLSGNGRDAIQTTPANQPIYRSSNSVASLPNGKPVLQFDGVNDTLATALFGTPLSQPSTIFVVGSATTSSGNHFFVDGITSRNTIHFDGAAADKLALFAGTVLGSTVTQPLATSVMTAQYSGASSQLWVNGVSVLTGNPGAQALDGVTLGAGAGGTSNFLAGQIAEVVIYNRVLTATERLQVEKYLYDKYQNPGYFKPSNLAGLALHFDASKIVNVVDGGTVATWADQSGNGRDLTQKTSTSLPTFQSSVTPTGLPAVKFTNTTGNGLSTTYNKADRLITMFAVYKGDQGAVYIRQPGSAGIPGQFENNNFYSRDAGGTVTTQASLNEDFTGFHVYTGVGAAAAGSPTAYRDGTLTATSAVAVSGAEPSTNTFLVNSLPTMGAATNAAYAEIIVYNRILTTTERQQVEAYLKRKYGTP